MPIETAGYISDLQPLNPAATDPMGQGDDHLRLIKTVLKNTLPNLTGAMTVDQGTLNALPGRVGTLEAERTADITTINGSIAFETSNREADTADVRAALVFEVANREADTASIRASLANNMADSLVTQALPGTVRLQAGRGSTGADGQALVGFPVPFGTQAASIVVSVNQADFTTTTVHVTSWNAAGFTAVTVTPSGTPAPGAAFSWIALGF